MPVYEYTCQSCGEVFSKFTSVSSRKEDQSCPNCEEGIGKYKISCPTISLDGTDPGFPGAWDKWEKKRKQKLAQEQRAKREHGDNA